MPPINQLWYMPVPSGVCIYLFQWETCSWANTISKGGRAIMTFWDGYSFRTYRCSLAYVKNFTKQIPLSLSHCLPLWPPVLFDCLHHLGRCCFLSPHLSQTPQSKLCHLLLDMGTYPKPLEIMHLAPWPSSKASARSFTAGNRFLNSATWVCLKWFSASTSNRKMTLIKHNY